MVGCCVFVMVKRALCLLRRLENRVRGRVEKGGGFGGEVGLSQTPLATKQPKRTKELVCEMVALLVVVVSPSFVISAAFTSCGFDLDLPTPENPFRRRLCFPSAAHFPLSP